MQWPLGLSQFVAGHESNHSFENGGVAKIAGACAGFAFAGADPPMVLRQRDPWAKAAAPTTESLSLISTECLAGLWINQMNARADRADHRFEGVFILSGQVSADGSFIPG